MDNLLHLIKSTKNLFAETLDLCIVLENDLEFDKMNIEKIEECLNRTKLKFTQIESIMSDVRNVEIKLLSNCKNGVESLLPEHAIANSMKVILFDIVNKIVESHEAVEILNDFPETRDVAKPEQSKNIKQSNIFSILDKEKNCKDKDGVSEIQIVSSDNSLDKKTANESFESDKQFIVDELFLQSNAAREAILVDSDTESESVKEPTSLIKECSVVLYDISKLSPDLKIDENQNSDRLEKEINRLCRIPNSSRPKRNRIKDEKLESETNRLCRIPNSSRPKRNRIKDVEKLERQSKVTGKKRISNIYQTSDSPSSSSSSSSKCSDLDYTNSD